MKPGGAAPVERVQQVTRPGRTPDVVALDFRQAQRAALVHVYEGADGDVLLLHSEFSSECPVLKRLE
jgi:hypothetical protein